jgi:hypothetical protein
MRQDRAYQETRHPRETDRLAERVEGLEFTLFLRKLLLQALVLLLVGPHGVKRIAWPRFSHVTISPWGAVTHTTTTTPAVAARPYQQHHWPAASPSVPKSLQSLRRRD